MKISIISGSMKVNGESARLARFFEKRCQDLLSAETYLLDLGITENRLPYWDEGTWGQQNDEFADWGKTWAPIKQQLQESDAFIIFAPEYNGTMPAVLKNFFHLTSQEELGHKAGLAVSVSAGINGAYPIAELRAHAVKNCKLVWVPDHIIIRNAGQMLQDNVPEGMEKYDAELRERVDWSLPMLAAYAEGLNGARASGKLFNKKYPFGM